MSHSLPGTATSAQAARDLVLSYLPRGDPVWLGGAEHSQHRLDVFHLSPPANDTLYVLSRVIGDTFVPAVVSTYPHVPYDTAAANAKPPRGEETGVFAWIELVHAPDAAQVRFVRSGSECTVPVTAGHALLIDWDSPWPLYADRPRPRALCIAGIWHPTVSGLVAATAEGFREGYRAYWDNGAQGDDWAPEAFREYEAGSFSEKVAMVEAILDGPGLSDFAHDCLAAGPVEELIGHDLLDYIADNAEVRVRWVARASSGRAGRASTPPTRRLAHRRKSLVRPAWMKVAPLILSWWTSTQPAAASASSCDCGF